MEWWIFALAAALFTGLASIAEKKALNDEHAIEFSVVFAIVNVLLTIPLLIWVSLEMPLDVMAIIYVATIFSGAGFYLRARALRHLDISFVIPLGL